MRFMSNLGVYKMSENYNNNATNSAGDKSVRDIAEKKEQEVRDTIQSWFPNLTITRKKMSGVDWFSMNRRLPGLDKMVDMTIAPDVVMYMNGKMLPIRIEDVNQKSENNGGPERLIRTIGEAWLDNIQEKHGYIKDFMPNDYPLPIFGCISCPPKALKYLFKNLGNSQIKYFYYMNDASEMLRLKNNLSSVVESVVKYCQENKLI